MARSPIHAHGDPLTLFRDPYAAVPRPESGPQSNLYPRIPLFPNQLSGTAAFRAIVLRATSLMFSMIHIMHCCQRRCRHTVPLFARTKPLNVFFMYRAPAEKCKKNRTLHPSKIASGQRKNTGLAPLPLGDRPKGPIPPCAEMRNLCVDRRNTVDVFYITFSVLLREDKCPDSNGLIHTYGVDLGRFTLQLGGLAHPEATVWALY